MDGRFHPKPFDFDELRAPSREIPLASVKVANRALEKQRPENEPFGKSGTRCGLFDPDVEEPFGVTYATSLDSNEYPVTGFKCQVNGPREAGRYNLSVALLGTAMMPDNNMQMGEAQVDWTDYATDHHGVSFMMQARAPLPAALGGSSITHPSLRGVSRGSRSNAAELSHSHADSPDTLAHPQT